MAAFHGGDAVGAIVVDIGSATTKIGWAGDDYPKALFRSVGVTTRRIVLRRSPAGVFAQLWCSNKPHLLFASFFVVSGPSRTWPFYARMDPVGREKSRK
jgi:hypothetical protein